MVRNIVAFTAAASMVASPCLAAGFGRFDDVGARRSGAAIGAYVEIPLDGPRQGRTRAGLRTSVVHDYRNARAPAAPVVRGDAFDLRLVGDGDPTLYMAGRPVTGERARQSRLAGPVNQVVGIVVLVAAVVGAVVIWQAIDDSGEE